MPQTLTTSTRPGSPRYSRDSSRTDTNSFRRHSTFSIMSTELCTPRLLRYCTVLYCTVLYCTCTLIQLKVTYHAVPSHARPSELHHGRPRGSDELPAESRADVGESEWYLLSLHSLSADTCCLGIDHPYTITEYTHLALYCFANTQVSTALKLLYRSDIIHIKNVTIATQTWSFREGLKKSLKSGPRAQFFLGGGRGQQE